MIRAKYALATAFVLLTASAPASAAGLAGTSGARASTTSLCHDDSAKVSGGAYVVENNEYASSAPECIRLAGNGPKFTVANSDIANKTDGAPGAFPSALFGCHWGSCTSGGLAADPVRVSALRAGSVTSSWYTVQSAAKDSAYDVAYDIWVSRTPRASGPPIGSEIMIWLNHRGSVQPMGHIVAHDVRIANHVYDIWYSPPASPANGDTISYTMVRPTRAVFRLDIAKVIHDSVRRGYTKPSWYLISVEAGFELWRGGAGLSTRYFTVRS